MITQAPKQITPRKLADYLEVISKAVFQIGISWRVVEAKWPGIREAFRGFDPAVVADFTEQELDSLAQDTRVIRNRRKLEGIVKNARTMLELEKQHRSFRAYLRSHGGFEATLKDLKKRFSFLGDMGGYYFLYVVGEDVPPHEEFGHNRQRQS
ncbi:MAG: hypothetical protein EXR47_02045 [Dehalococcoidia bacterium]|nr:hypothetical protein [Dehalococcoidia bacterium]